MVPQRHDTPDSAVPCKAGAAAKNKYEEGTIIEFEAVSRLDSQVEREDSRHGGNKQCVTR